MAKYFVGISDSVQNMLMRNADPYNCIDAEVVEKVQAELQEQISNLERLSAALFAHEQRGECPLTVHLYKKGVPYISVGQSDQFLRNNYFVDEVAPKAEPEVEFRGLEPNRGWVTTQ